MSSSKSMSLSRRPASSLSVPATLTPMVQSASSSSVIRTSAAQAIRSISTGNSAALATARTIPFPTPARGSIPTVTPLVLPSSTVSMNTMTMIRTVIPSQNTIREEAAGTSPGDVRMANIARTTLHLKVQRKNTMTMTVLIGVAQQLTALRIIRRKVIIARMK